MKRSALLSAAVALLAVSVILTLPDQERMAPSRYDLATDVPNYESYKFKRDGKIPKRLQAYPGGTFMEMRAYPYTTLPDGAYEKAMAEAEEMHRAARFRGPAAAGILATGAWQQAGPTNVPGRITSIHVPDIPGRNVIYAGSAAGGVFKSTDKGSTWVQIFDDVGTIGVGAIAGHPTDPDILYVGTGEASASIDSYYGTGIYKTVDGGLTWTGPSLPNSFRFGKIIVDPLRPDTVFAAAFGYRYAGQYGSDKGLWRSEDAGTSWTRVLTTPSNAGVIDVDLDPNTGVVLAVIWNWTQGSATAVWRSSTFGTSGSFSVLSGTGGLPVDTDAGGNFGRIGVEVEPVTGTWFVVHVDGSDQTIESVYKSTDSLGVNWTRTDDGGIDGQGGGFAWYFGQVRAKIGNPDEVWVLAVSLRKTENGGNSSWFNNTGIQHVDFHDLIAFADGEVFTGTDGGVNYSSNSGGSWTTFFNMPNTQFYAITLDYQNPERLYGGTQDNGTNRTLTGALDDWTRIFGGDGFYTLVDYANPDIIYAESQFGNLARSDDGGFSFSSITGGTSGTTNWNTPVEMDPNDPRILYYGSDRVFRSRDRGESWTDLSGDLTSGSMKAIGVAKSDSNVIYTGSSSGGVWVTTNAYDATPNWTLISGSLPNRWVTRLTVDPTNAAIVYLTLSGYQTNAETLPRIYRSTNFGTTWTQIQSNLPDAPLNDVIIDPHDLNTLYVGSDVGVYVTTDLGGTWAPLGTDLPITCVHDLVMDPKTRKLVAGTHGRSMYSVIVDCPGTTDSDADGVPDVCDNCPGTSNADQSDLDGDFIGDVCDDCTDRDFDGFGEGFGNEICAADNCVDAFNPDQTDADSNGIGDVCEVDNSIVLDQITNDVVSLTIDNFGRYGSQNGTGFSFNGVGDCGGSYLFSGSPAIITNAASSPVLSEFFQNDRDVSKVAVGNPTVPVTNFGNYRYYNSGTVQTQDGRIRYEAEFYAPDQADVNRSYMILGYKVYTGNSDTNTFSFGSIIDWDIPDFGSNTGTGIADDGMIVQIGAGVSCIDNTNRFGGNAVIGIDVGDGVINSADSEAGRVNDNPTFIFANGGNYLPGVLDSIWRAGGFQWNGVADDAHTVLSFANDLAVGPGDTVRIYTVLGAVRDGSSADLSTLKQDATTWFSDNIETIVGGCCVGSTGDVNCDGSVGLPDLSTLIDHLFISFTPLCCDGEADLTGTDGLVNLADLSTLIDHLFISLAPLRNCQ